MPPAIDPVDFVDRQMGNRSLGHLWEENGYPVTTRETVTELQVCGSIGQSADLNKRVLEILADRRLMYQRDAVGFMRPFIAYVYANVVALG
jgi:hypothetical protein